MQQQFFAIGVITNTHNLKGEVRFLPHYPEFPIKKLTKLYIDHYGQYMILEIERARPHKKFWLLKFKNYERIDDVIKFKGSAALVERKGAPKLNKGNYYWEEIIGCKLINHRKELYGKVTGVLPSFGHPVYLVDTGIGYEKMVPAATQFIKSIDLKKKKIVLTEAALAVLE